MNQQTNGVGNGDAPVYSFTVRLERPIQGCEIVPNPFLQLRSSLSHESASTRPRMVDPNSFNYSFVWRRGPRRSGCANPSCSRGNSFEPMQWSKASLGGPELICSVCTSAGFPAHEACFCSRSCFISAWKEHAKRHVSVKVHEDEDHEDNNEHENEDVANGEVAVPAAPTTSTTTTESAQGPEWVVVGQHKSYTPTAADVGCRLRVEVSAISVADKSILAGPVAIFSEPVLSQPVRPPKRSLHLIPGAGAGIPGAIRFRVVSYNILAELYATKQAYPYCDAWNLSWPFRRKIILDELEETQGDIVCLQEVQADHYEQDVLPFMNRLGYDGLYKPKSREFIGQYAKVDGCATFWKKNKFILNQNYSLEFNHMARQEASSLGFDESDARRYMNRLNRDNIAQIVVLEALSRSATGRSVAGNLNRSLLCVVNTHLYSNHQHPDVKLWQTMNLMRELQGIVSSRDLPLMICGDFNSEPSSAVYEFMTRGSISHDHPELSVNTQENAMRILPDTHNIAHGLHLSSAMQSAFSSEPLFTNFTSKFRGTLDYIFYSPSKLRVMAATAIPEEADLRAAGGEGLPCACYPSDHILLCCDIALMTSPSGNNVVDPNVMMQGSSTKMAKGVRGK